MTRQSQRLRRILRKYALDLRIARMTQANAARENATIIVAGQRLATARAALACGIGNYRGGELVGSGEWAGRIDLASHELQPARARAEAACTAAALGSRQAQGRVAILQDRIEGARRLEDRQDAARTTACAPTPPIRHRRRS